MNNQLGVTLYFTADTEKAKTNIDNLQQSLKNLSNNIGLKSKDSPFNNLSSDIRKATTDLAKLQQTFNSSINETTGRLNLVQFTRSMKESGMSLKDYQNTLLDLGVEGQKTFLNLSKAIIEAEVPLRTTNKLVDSFVISLKNTAKWMISSSLLKGFVGSFQQAFGYAKDLNSSLNQIQIVTQNSTEQMGEFAKEANRAASKLSTTTVDYTNAALIYYQQGLSDAEVKKRTDITIEAANAAGASAEEMSSYLTAVWNSYKVGEDQLERYADIMAALGAGTATSLEEISTAMEKVASVGEATGVKFEQLSSIIATVSSVTRTSAESVGTAYKTIFARMADLKLEGSVEEDGVTTTLGTVSSQLAQVGVNILEDNGELRNMGEVLEELMDKWNGMNNATQQAVAIALAGKRQYTQLLALMNNQELYQQSMGIAEGAEGTLQKQQDTFATGWEAALKRVKAAAEGIYDSLINDKFFIDFNNGLAEVLKSIETMIDSMGGFYGLLLNIGSIAMIVFQKQIANGIQSAIQNIQLLFPAGQEKLINEKIAWANAAKDMAIDAGTAMAGEYGLQGSAQNTALDNQLNTRIQLIKYGEELSEQEREIVSFLIDQNDAINDELVQKAKIAEATRKQAEAEKEILNLGVSSKNSPDPLGERLYRNTKQSTGAELLHNSFSSIKGLEQKDIQQQNAIIENSRKQLEIYIKSVEELGAGLQETFGRGPAEAIRKFQDALKAGDINQITEAYTKFGQTVKMNTATIEESIINNEKIRAEVEKQISANQEEAVTEEQVTEAIKQRIQAVKEAAMAEGEFNHEQAKSTVQTKALLQQIEQMGIKMPTVSQAWTSMASTITSLSVTISGTINLFKTLSNPDVSGLDKFLAILMQISFILPNIITLIKGVTSGKALLNLVTIATAGSLTKEVIASHATELSLKGVAKGALEAAGGFQGLAASIWAAMGPFILIAAVIGGIIAVFVAIYKQQENYVKGLEKQAKASKEAADKQKELEQTSKDLEQSITSLIDKLNEQKNAGEDVSETYEELSEKVQQLKKDFLSAGVKEATISLIDQGIAIGQATGNWENYNNAIAKANKEMAKITGQKAIQSEQDTLKATQAKGNWKGGFEPKEISQESRDVIKKHSNVIEESVNQNGSYSLTLTTGTTTGEFLNDYKELSQILDELKQKGQENTTVYKNLKDTLDIMAEGYEELSANYEKNANFILSQNMEKLFGENITPKNIDNLDAYIYSMQQLSKETEYYFGSAEEAEKQTKRFLAAYGASPEAQQAFDFLVRFSELQQKTLLGDQQDGFTKRLSRDMHQDVLLPGDNAGPSLSLEEEYNKQVKEMYNFINSMSGERQQIAFKVKLDYIKSFDDFKNAFNKIEAFEKDVKIKIDPHQVLDEAASIRENLSEYMEKFSEQGHLTMTQAVSLLDEFPQYEKYLTKTSEGYAFTTEAINDFNKALENQKQALDEIFNPANVGKDALVQLGEEFINIENAFSENSGLKNFSLTMQEISTSLIDGKINIEDYFNSLNEEFDKINYNALSTKDNTILLNNTIPNLISSIIEFGKANKDAFEQGRIGATEYRSSLRQVFKEIISMEKVSREIAENQLSTFNQKEIEENSEAYNNLKQQINASKKALEQYQEALNDFNDVEPIAQAFEKNYNNLVDIFDENDFSIKINTEEEFNNARANLVQLVQDMQAGFAGLSDTAKANVRELITAYAEGDLEIANTANSILDGTTNLATTDTAVLTEVAQLAGKAAADTAGKVGTLTDQIIDGITELITNFNASIQFTPQALDQTTKFPIKVSILGQEIEVASIGVPNFKVDMQGGVTGDSAKTLTGIASAAKSLFNSSGVNSSGLGAFKPKSSAGSSSAPMLDAEPKSSKGKSGSGGKGGSGGGDGGDKGSSKSPQRTKAVEPDEVDDEVTRYKNTDSLLESQSKNLEKIERTKNKVFGQKYIDAIEQEIEALEKENDLLRWQMEEASTYSEENRQKFSEVAKSLGLDIEIEIDENGFVVDGEQIEQAIIDKRKEFAQMIADETNAENAAWDNLNNSAGEDGLDDATKWAHEDKMDAIDKEKEAQEKSIKELTDAYENYIDSNNKKIADQEKLEENILKQQEERYEAINYKLQERLEMHEREIKYLELEKRLIEKSYKNGPEIFSQVYDNLEKTGVNIQDGVNAQIEAYEEAREKFENGEIGADKWAEIQKSTMDKLMDGANEWMDNAEKMDALFSDMLDKWAERIDRINGQFDNMLNVLDQVKTIQELKLGGATDYKALSELYKTQAKVAENYYQSSMDTYNTQQKSLEMAQKELANLSGDAAEDYKKNTIEPLEDAVKEAQENMYANAIQYIKALEAIKDNALAEQSQRLRNRLGGGTDIDQVADDLAFKKTRQDDYLTATNQLYETQKLIRQANLDLDKSENDLAKNKLKLFIKETEELQKQGKMSKFELEVQKAKYDLLVAELALQDAQNNKSQVRLQRDSEGNFNYVYSADEDKIAEAQQAYADAENDLYNIRLNGANDFAEKYIAAMQQLADDLEAIDNDGELSLQERERRKKELIEENTEYLKDLSTQYSIAIRDDSRVVKDAYTSDMMENIATTGEFEKATDIYMDQTKKILSDYSKKVKTVSNDMAVDYDAMINKSGTLRQETKDLNDTYQTEMDTMIDRMGDWSNQSVNYLQHVISYWKELADSIKEAYNAATGFDRSTDYFATYQRSTTIKGARAALEERFNKMEGYPDLYSYFKNNIDALIEEDNDQAQDFYSKLENDNINGAIAALSRRQAKLEYLEDNGIDYRAYGMQSNWEMANGYSGPYADLIKSIISGKGGQGKTFTFNQDLINEISKALLEKTGSFDTGGYTGEFGPEGKLAMLHEKELVLNQNDTKNLLDTIDVVDRLLNSFEFQNLQYRFQNNLSAVRPDNWGPQELQQDVHIQAEFPNVQDHNEIEMALSNLVNTAAQYANRES